MSYRPQRTFNGTQGNPSTDTMGPEQLSHDIDELCKMFNPTSIHSDGSAGGVTADNLNFTGLDINEIGGVASGDIKAIRVKMNGDIEYTTDGETYHPAFAREANYLPLAGGTMSGTLNMNNNKITNLATPEVGSDPATKNYTDAIRTALEVALALKAPIDSPTFTGTPTAPTPSTEDSSTQIATTAFTQAVAAGVAGNTYSKADADAKFETIANANKLVKDVSYNSETGTFTIVTQDGTTTSIDTNIEKIPVSVSIIQSGSTYKLRITNEDGSYSECDVSAMFNAITFVDSTEITFTETTNQDGSKNVTASIKPGSIVGSKLDPDYKDILDALVDRAETAETNAQNSADNAADSATAAAGSASAASSSASAAASSVTSASQYASAAEGFKNQASNSATAAASSATEAATSASNASTSETNAAASASSAATSASNAATSASDAASDAQRTQELTNEAMEYATDAAGSQIDAETAARNAAASASTASTKASQAATSASNASTSETNAANSATAAAASAASVGTQASDAEAAARGTRNGVPVGPDDEFYHDNAEYYKDQAASIVGPQQPKITATGILKGEGDGVVSAAVAGTDYQAPLPSQSGQSGKFLTTDGSALSWDSVDALPSQTGQSGKFLTTNGTEASWADNPPDIFWVNVESERDSTTGTITYTANKTALEIWAAIGEGKLPIVIIRDFQYCIYTSGSYNDGILALYFYCNFGQPYDLRVRFLYNRSTGNETVSVDKVDPEVFLVTATTSNGTITADKTYAEILAAYNAGKICVVNFDNSHVCPLMYISSTGASFCKTATTSDGAYQRDVSVTNADVWNTTVVPLQTRTTASGILKGNGSGTITAAVAGTDYAAASHNHDIENLTNFSSRVYDATISRTKNTVLAAPNGSNGAATFRALVAADIPANLETFEVALWGLGTTAQPYTADKTFAQILAASTAGKIVVLRYGQTQTNNYVDYYPLVYRSTSAIRFSRTNMSGESGFSVSSSDAWSKTAGDSVQTIASDAVDSAINRTTTVNAADTNYTTYMARGEALNSADTNPTKNGTISWTYA